MITVFDAGADYADRYTVIIGKDIFGMSHNADQPNGFNQYTGNLTKPLEMIKAVNWGNPAQLGDLPKGTLVAIIQRLEA